MGTRAELWAQLNNAVNACLYIDYVSWLIFSIFWAANAVLLATVFDKNVSVQRGMVISCIGALSSLVWWIIQVRALAHERIRKNIAAELEETLLGGRCQNLFVFAWRKPPFNWHYQTTLPANPFIKGSPAVVAHFWALLSGAFVRSIWPEVDISCSMESVDLVFVGLVILAWPILCFCSMKFEKDPKKKFGRGLLVCKVLLGTISIISFAALGVFFVGQNLTSFVNSPTK